MINLAHLSYIVASADAGGAKTLTYHLTDGKSLRAEDVQLLTVDSEGSIRFFSANRGHSIPHADYLKNVL